MDICTYDQEEQSQKEEGKRITHTQVEDDDKASTCSSDHTVVVDTRDQNFASSPEDELMLTQMYQAPKDYGIGDKVSVDYTGSKLEVYHGSVTQVNSNQC